jgi:hypothetical protein
MGSGRSIILGSLAGGVWTKALSLLILKIERCGHVGTCHGDGGSERAARLEAGCQHSVHGCLPGRNGSV